MLNAIKTETSNAKNPRSVSDPQTRLSAVISQNLVQVKTNVATRNRNIPLARKRSFGTDLVKMWTFCACQSLGMLTYVVIQTQLSGITEKVDGKDMSCTSNRGGYIRRYRNQIGKEQKESRQSRKKGLQATFGVIRTESQITAPAKPIPADLKSVKCVRNWHIKLSVKRGSTGAVTLSEWHFSFLLTNFSEQYLTGPFIVSGINLHVNLNSIQMENDRVVCGLDFSFATVHLPIKYESKIVIFIYLQLILIYISDR